MSQNHGKLFTFEGIDGSGKSTLVKLVYNQLKTKFPVVLHREPTDFPTGQKIRSFLRGEITVDKNEQIDLFLLDRAESVKKIILPALESGSIVIMDRYYHSTAAYQGSKDFPPEKILELNQQKGFPSPDLVFYLDINPVAALIRVQKRNPELDVFESEKELTRIRSNYLKLFNNIGEVCILNAELSQEELLVIVASKIKSMS